MIKHVLADGTELKSIAGRIVPATGNTEAAYRIAAKYLKGFGGPGSSGAGGCRVQTLQAKEKQ